MQKKLLDSIVVHLKKGESVILPFDTCYGLVCDGLSEPAASRLYQLKQRPRSKPSALVVPDIEMIEEYAILSAPQRQILRRLLPGAVTVILRLKEGVKLPRGFVATKYGTASFRVIRSDEVSAVLKAFKRPLLATSANVSGRPVLLSRVDLVMHHFNHERLARVIKVMDHVFERPAHSTVVDLTTDMPEVVREGAVPISEIQQAI